MKLNIVCAFDAIFDINNQQYEMIKNASTIEMDLNDGESLLLKAYPISSKNLLPFAADLKNINGKFETKSWQVFVWKQDQESTDIEILPFEVKSFSFDKVVKENFGAFDVMLFKGEHASIFYVDGGDGVCIYNIAHKILKHNLGQFKSAPYILAQTENFKLLAIFCPINFEFKVFKASQINFGEDEITLIEKQFNHSGHAKEILIKFDEEKGIVLTEELLYVENAPNVASAPAVLPLAFFDAVKQKDFDLAKYYLTEDLKRSVSSAVLEEYFGEFYEVVPYNFNVSKGYYAAIKSEGKTQIFCFKVLNGKIAEIEPVK